MYNYLQRITAKLKIVFLSPLVLWFCKLLLFFILVTYNFEQIEWTYYFHFLKLVNAVNFTYQRSYYFPIPKWQGYLMGVRSRPQMKKAVKNLAIFTRKYLSALRPATLLKIDTNTGVFLLILRNFSEHLFWRTFANGCF